MQMQIVGQKHYRSGGKARAALKLSARQLGILLILLMLLFLSFRTKPAFCDLDSIIKEYGYVLNINRVQLRDTIVINATLSAIITDINCQAKSISVNLLNGDSIESVTYISKKRLVKKQLYIIDPSTGQSRIEHRKYFILRRINN